jgi:linoleoyl-CoA desaturase
MSTLQIRYNQQNNEYYRVLRSRVNAYFERRGISKYANTAMHIRIASILAIFASSYGLILSNRFRSWDLFLLQVFFHFTMFVMSVAIAHDGSHSAYSPKRWANKAVEFVFDLIGINSHFWTYNHIYAHHAGPNIPFHDSAIESFSLVRLHPRTKRSKIHKYQHLYMFAIYALVPLFLVLVLEFLSFKQKVAGYKDTDEHSLSQIVFMCISKVLVIGYTLGVPLALVDAPPWHVVSGFLAGHLVCGISLGIVFQTTHMSDYSAFPEPDETGLIDNSYAVHIMKTTSSFAVNNRLVTFLSGGLNIHTTHHLFPGICQIHLPALVGIVRETAREFGIPYKEYTLLGAIASHIRLLKRLGNCPSYSSFSTSSTRCTTAPSVALDPGGTVAAMPGRSPANYVAAKRILLEIEQ